jgi:hypothetical protein
MAIEESGNCTSSLALRKLLQIRGADRYYVAVTPAQIDLCISKITRLKSAGAGLIKSVMKARRRDNSLRGSFSVVEFLACFLDRLPKSDNRMNTCMSPRLFVVAER